MNSKITVILLLSSALASPVQSARVLSENRCASLNANYYAQTAHKGHFVVVASHSGLKDLNTLFGEWGQGSELLLSYLHFFFQKNLHAELSSLENFDVTQATADIIKFVTLWVSNSPDSAKEITNAVVRAHKSAVEKLTRYIFSRSPDVINEVSEIIGPLSALGKTGQFIFPERRTYIRPLPAGQEEEMIRLLRQRFAGAGEFKRFISRGYGVGISLESHDSHLAAKIATNHDSDEQVIFFDMSHLYETLVEAQELRTKLNKIFTTTSESDLSKFTLIRTNLDNGPAKWTVSYRKLLAKAATSGEPLQVIDQRLKRYAQAVNILDFLPLERDPLTAKMREQFEAVKNPSGALFWDIRKVGARNLVASHNAAPFILAKLKKLAKLNGQLEKEGRQAAKTPLGVVIESPEMRRLNKEIDRVYFEEFLPLRREIFIATADFIISVKRRISDLLRAKIGKSGDFAIWATGDDGFSAIRSEVPMELLALAIKQDPYLSEVVRIGFMDTPGINSIAVETARFTVGRLATPLKVSEEFGANFIAQYALRGGEESALFYYPSAGRLDPVDDFSIQKFRSVLRDWQIFSGN